MATSSSINYSIDRDGIIEEALMGLQVLPEGGAPTSAQLDDHSRTLNLMVKSWMARRGMKLWCVERVTVFLDEDKATYTFATDNITLSSDVVRTTVSADEASGQTTISATSITGLTNGDFVGIELDDGTMQWTTINGVPAAGMFVITTALTGAASAGNQIYSYTTKYARGAKYVIEALRRDKSLNDSPVNIISRQEYQRFGTKGTDGKITNISVEPGAPHAATLTIRVYPESDNETDALELVVLRTLEDFDAATDTPDFPQEYWEALVLGLRARLASFYGKPISERRYFDEQAEIALQQVEDFDFEHETSVFFSPRMR